MKIVNFQIDWDDRIKLDNDKIQFDPEDFTEWSTLHQLVFKLSSFYECPWFIVIDNYRLQFNYRPDLTTVFFKLPDMLEFIIYNELGQYSLYFYEQGTDLALIIENCGTYVTLLLKKYEYSRFGLLPTEKMLVQKDVFCRSWIKFIRKVLKEVAEDNPDYIADISLTDYQNTIDEVEVLIL